MSQKRRNTNLSASHSSLKKRSRRKICPGCSRSFHINYFNEHKRNFYIDGCWQCNCASKDKDPFDSTNVSSDENETENVNFLQEKLRKRFRQHVRRFITEEDIAGFPSENCEESEDEIWEDTSEIDIDADLESNTLDDTQPVQDTSSGNANMTLVMWFCIFICVVQSVFGLPDIVISEILNFLKLFFETLVISHPGATSISLLFPGTIYMLWKTLNFKRDNFTKYVVCRKCYSLYKYEDCLLRIEGRYESAKCSFVEFPNHTQMARRRPCGQPLLKTVTLSSGRVKLYPYKIFCYKPIEHTMKRFLKRAAFEEHCESWRDREMMTGLLRDVYDGKVWKLFESEQMGFFLKEPRRYCIMLNLDWFQPFQHVSYSVGVIYGVVLNLPRKERFKLDNVILVGIIPDMGKEPKTNTFLRPLVDELLVAWKHGFSTKTFQSPKQPVQFKLALICTGCDVPATRKLCGFLGHTAKLGCSKCLKEFPGQVGAKDYSGFEVENWEKRTMSRHTVAVKMVENAKTQTTKEQLESKYGVRYSCLLDLPYFDPIRMSIIDPMHNLYLGTAKYMIRVWQNADVLTDTNFSEIQMRVDSIETPSTIGRIPRKIASSFGGFTAEQFMHWTNLFSLLALRGMMSTKYLDHWQTFVLASRIVCSNVLKVAELEMFDEYMLKFCKTFEKLFGKDLVTPNMHLHHHITECVKDFGPIHCFWLFSFERYNGHLGSFPNNSRAVEIQFMRRFLRDSLVNAIEFPREMQEHFSDSLNKLLRARRSVYEGSSLSEDDISRLHHLADVSTSVFHQQWDAVEYYSLKGTSNAILSEEEHHFLQRLYKTLYCETFETHSVIIPTSYKEAKAVSVGNEVFGTSRSRYKRSSYILANWNSGNGKLVSDTEMNMQAGQIEKILCHNLIVDGRSSVHILAKVSWYVPFSELRPSDCVVPIQAYKPDAYDVFGESGFMPLQRIFCKFIEMNDRVRQRKVRLVCPVSMSKY